MTRLAVKRCIPAKQFRLGWHAVQHMFEEGFSHEDLIASLLAKMTVLEEYEAENRVLLLGYFHAGGTLCPLHAVCEFSQPDHVDIITAYIPGRPHWINERQRG